jgi:hypothetical protein
MRGRHSDKSEAELALQRKYELLKKKKAQVSESPALGIKAPGGLQLCAADPSPAGAAARAASPAEGRRRARRARPHPRAGQALLGQAGGHRAAAAEARR